MTTGFTIDDVRDTLTADVTRFLGRIEATAREILERRELDADTVPSALPLFQTIGDHGHAIYGTSCLVAAGSLSSSAHALEELAARGRDELARGARHLARARGIAVALVAGAGDMLAMLSLELDHRQREADTVATGWRLRAEELLATRASQVSLLTPEDKDENEDEDEDADDNAAAPSVLAMPAPPSSPPGLDDGWSVADNPGGDAGLDGAGPAIAADEADGFSFATSAVELPVDVGTAAIDAELAVIFQEEARTTLVALAEQLHAFAASPADRARCRDLERSYHTLKGAAATVGLVALSERAAALQLRVEALLDGAEPASPDFIAALARDTEALRRCAGLEPSSAASLAAGPAELDETRAVFAVEARALCREATRLAAVLASSPPGPDGDDAETRAALRRVLHRLRGSALVVADEAIAEQARVAQEAVGHGALPDAMARLATLLDIDDGGRMGGTGDQRQRVAVPRPDAEIEPGFQQECAELLGRLDRDLLELERAERPRDQLPEILRDYHTLKGVVNAMGLRPTGELIHQVEDAIDGLLAAVILPPLRGVASRLLAVHAEIRRHLRTAHHGYVEAAPGRFARQLRGLVTGEPPASGASPSTSARSASNLGAGSEPGATSDGPDRRHLRVSIDRLDALMNLTGELVINRSRLLNRIDALRSLQGDLGRSSKHLLEVVEKFRDDHEFSSLAHPRAAAGAEAWPAFSELELDRYEDVNILARSLAESSTDIQEIFGQIGGGLAALVDDSDSLGGIIAGIQGEVTQTRMVPLAAVFSRLQLPIRDAAQREGREVNVITEGEHVHLDKTIVDALFQPMLHLVRNAVSHGIEPATSRIAAGKGAAGTVSLRARQELGQIVVEVHDDGAGLDLERLRERGVAMGLIGADVLVDDPRVKELVFAPGLTTHRAAGAVAGRGVGCDVVRRTVERLNGSVRVETVRGRGTAFVVSLPLTLAITRALLVRHGGQTFAIPLYFTERILDVEEHELVESAGHRRVEVDGTFVTVRRLAELVAVGDSTAERGPIVLLRVGDQRLTVQVDAVVGQEELVVKGLGALLTGHPRFAGVTIRGTGEIVLILDVPGLVDATAQSVERRDEPRRAARTLAAPSVSPSRAAGASPARPSASAAGALRVLFVDDSVSVRRVAERALRALGVEVGLAVDGIDALDKLHAEPYDLVFTNLEMPRMHGYELIRELRFLPAFSALPVIVVTSRSGKKHREEAHALGATHYMTKPFSPQSLAAALVRFGGPRARGLGGHVPDGAPSSEASP